MGNFAGYEEVAVVRLVLMLEYYLCLYNFPGIRDWNLLAVDRIRWDCPELCTLEHSTSPLTLTEIRSADGLFVRVHICGYDLNLTYPQRGHFHTLIDPCQTVAPNSPFAQDSFSQGKSLRRRTAARTFAKRRGSAALNPRDIEERGD
jgi:hypothetical protein